MGIDMWKTVNEIRVRKSENPPCILNVTFPFSSVGHGVPVGSVLAMGAHGWNALVSELPKKTPADTITPVKAVRLLNHGTLNRES
jgi:hypothetical protein